MNAIDRTSAGSLDGKVVVIAGGGGAQGGVCAQLCASEGARVVIADVDHAALAEVATSIESVGGIVRVATLNVTDEQSWADLIEFAQTEFGRVDGFVNFVGILARAGFEDTEREDWDRVIEVNLTGAWLGVKKVLPALRAAGGGSIVNIGTMDSLVGRGVSASYQASKGGLRMMSKNAATQYAPEGIRVNTVHPGAMELRVKTVLGPVADPDAVVAMMEGLRQATPLRRLGTALDIAYAVRYLLSDESSYVTGIDLPVDGGYTVP